MDIFKTLILDTPDTLSNISGILPVSNGGTGADNAPDARVNLLPSYTGNANKVLSLNSGATDVEWTSNGAGDVVGPASATDNAVVRYDGTTGKLVQDSTVTIDDSGNVGVAGAITNTKYFAGGGGGANPGGLGGSKYVMDWFDGSHRSFSYGADASTNGAWAWNSQRSDGTNAVAVMSLDSTGLNSTAIGATTASTGAFTTLSATSTANNAGQVALLLQNADGNAGIGSRLAWRLDNLANEWGYINVNRVGGGATAQMDFAVNGAAYSGAASTVMSLDSTGIQMATTSQISFFTAGYFVRASSGLEVQSADYTRFLTNGANERMRIDASGNVGIGTASPAVAGAGKNSLDVNGPVLARGGVGANQTSAGALDTSGNDLRIRSWGATAGTGTMSFRTGGGGGSVDAEAMRITSTGNVGIGTASPDSKLHVRNDGTGVVLAKFESDLGANTRDFRIKSPVLDSTTYPFRFTTSNSFAFEVDGVENLRIHSDGNVGIGSTAPAHKLTVSEASTDFAALISNSTSSGNGLKINAGDNSGDRILELNDKDGNGKMRVLANGDFFINGTTLDGTENSAGYSAGGLSFRVSRDTTANANQIVFYNPNGAIGAIQTNGSATAYNTSSDYRLKENVVPMQDALQRITQLKPSRFNFIADDSVVVDGFIAHEVQEHVPEAISGEKDAMRDEEYEVTPAVLDDDGNEITPAVMDTRSVPEYQGIDQSKLVPLLVGAIQELTARIAALENN